MQYPPRPFVKDVVLLGGGHSHVEVLRSFGMRPVPGARLTLITKDVMTPYSGMLPGFVSGYYDYEDVHIDLRRLARFAQSRLIHAEAVGLDMKNRSVLLKDRPSVKYDVLSIDIGSTPSDGGVPGAKEFTTAVKPISTFIERFCLMLEAFQSPNPPQPSLSERPRAMPSRRASAMRQVGARGFCVAVVGGGAGGVELAFAMKHRLLVEAEQTNQNQISEPNVLIVSKGPLLQGYPASVREMVLSHFTDRGIDVYQNNAVVEVEEGCLKLSNGQMLYFDGCLWCTQAHGSGWIASSGLSTDESGFIKINNFLQPFSGPADVFAAGDIASSVLHPRPKAGVFAVRQGPPLAANIRRFLNGEELVSFIPQSSYLSLISTGDKFCVASKGPFSWQGRAMWWLKDNIDRKFMYKYGRDLPDMETMRRPRDLNKDDTALNLIQKQAVILHEQSKKRCAGCGGKVEIRQSE